MAAIRSLKNRKAPGQDILSAELFKTDPEFAAQVLQPLFAAISYGRRNCYQKTGQKASLWRSWRKEPWATATTGEASPYCQCQARSCQDHHQVNFGGSRLATAKQASRFLKRKRGIDQIFSLRNITEQCTEWPRQLNINFVDFEKVFDSIHQDSLWHILRAYGIPQQIVHVIQSFYNNFTSRVGNSKSSFEVKTGVRQGCWMLALFFNIVIDWVMWWTTEDQPCGIRWTFFSPLEDLYFAYNLALASHTHQHM